ncbi:precorrin methylase [Tabrizicola sp. TH137]|uniref:cobalamin biosynthesis protein n=1 Tax=Tabrizicola sp. TH137 TaxID=2067452 RepID=UPI000C7B760F|nr:cobalamin biosynthesis protein [Tabrizicola sp. TH137]PLL14161.1 precorrin methylase [Tabrizicola sp. TH137]
MIVAGIGLRAATTLATLTALLQSAEETTGHPVQALATATEKATHPALTALARSRALPLHPVAIDGIATPTHSPRITARFRTGSVAEAAALAAAGPGATLTLARITAPDGMATLAIATSQGPHP